MRVKTPCDKASLGGYADAVPAVWQLLTEDPAERATFAELASTLALPGKPAGPPNRLRQVVRIDALGSSYYLKCFHKTQWKNRVRFATTAPRAADDASRELRVTQALRRAGYAAPRPVACGRDGARSYYLCAALPGEALADRLIAGDVDHTLVDRAARFCGSMLAAGFRLPDLSADHVFATDSGQLAVLDLHNGGVGAPGRHPRRMLARVLRRFAKSVRALPLARNAAMRFAARMLRAASTTRAMRRVLLTAAQPFGTASRYEDRERSRGYAERNPARNARELELLARVWPGRAGERVLDMPCGAGRLLPFLEARGHRVAQADGALAMLRQVTARGVNGALTVQANALQMPFSDDAVDGVVMFRFLHHMPPDAARAAIQEACRVAERFVVVSFFHPVSAHHVRRRAKQLLGAPATRFAMTLGEVSRVAARAGFRRAASAAQWPYVRDLWVVAFVRAPEHR